MPTPVHWPPLPYPLLFLLAEDRLQRGDVGCALAFLLAFTALLRISAVAGLRVCDVVFPAPGGATSRLFPSAQALRAALHESLAALGVAHVGFVFHSLRAGGALFLLNCDMELAEVLRRGRWRRPESARPYL